MLRPSMQTLKHIVVNIYVDKLGDDLLFSIPSELEDMRTKNIIETITINIMLRSLQMDESYRQGDVWSRLDEVLTTPGWFSLKRVSLTINFNMSDLDDEVKLEVALRKLAETQFPQLSSSNSVSFNLKVIPDVF